MDFSMSALRYPLAEAEKAKAPLFRKQNNDALRF